MHKSSLLRMQTFVEKYIDDTCEKKVLDVGSYNVNGCYRDLFSSMKIKYVGLDIEQGPNVDIVVKSMYEWNEIEDESYDYIISGQALEHMEYPWLAMMQIYKKLKREGIACIIAPNGYWEHKYPLDCYRFFEDGMIALAKWADFEIVESSVAGVPSLSVSKEWDEFCNDAVIVLTKSKSIAARYKENPMFNIERRYEPIWDIKLNYDFVGKWSVHPEYDGYIVSYLKRNRYEKVVIVGNDYAGKLLEKVLMENGITYSVISTMRRVYMEEVGWEEGRLRDDITEYDGTIVVLSIIDKYRSNIIEAKEKCNVNVRYIDEIVSLGQLIIEKFYADECYLYGAGYYGKMLLDIVSKIGINVNGFIVSDDHYREKEAYGKTIYKLSEIDKSAPIIVSLSDSEAIMKKLEKLGYESFIDGGKLL